MLKVTGGLLEGVIMSYFNLRREWSRIKTNKFGLLSKLQPMVTPVGHPPPGQKSLSHPVRCLRKPMSICVGAKYSIFCLQGGLSLETCNISKNIFSWVIITQMFGVLRF